MALDVTVGLGRSSQDEELWADIESELYSSTREASIGCFALQGCDRRREIVEPSTSAPTGSREPTMMLTHCSQCGGDRMIPVIAENRIKFFCRDCYEEGGHYLVG